MRFHKFVEVLWLAFFGARPRLEFYSAPTLLTGMLGALLSLAAFAGLIAWDFKQVNGKSDVRALLILLFSYIFGVVILSSHVFNVLSGLWVAFIFRREYGTFARLFAHALDANA